MNAFESELEKGKFMIPECLKCNEAVWPPSDYCSNCFSKVTLRESDGIGTILEFSKNNDTIFCLVEFEKKIRVLSTLKENSKKPEINKQVKLENCKMDGKNYYFYVSIL